MFRRLDGDGTWFYSLTVPPLRCSAEEKADAKSDSKTPTYLSSPTLLRPSLWKLPSPILSSQPNFAFLASQLS